MSASNSIVQILSLDFELELMLSEYQDPQEGFSKHRVLRLIPVSFAFLASPPVMPALLTQGPQ